LNIMNDDEYEYVHEKEKRKRYHRRELAILKVANGNPPVCAICGCPHLEILQFGHYKGDGKYHRKEIGGHGRIIEWIHQYPLKTVLDKIQLECPYCNFWHALFGEYPSKEKRPNWDHVKKEDIQQFQKLLTDEEMGG